MTMNDDMPDVNGGRSDPGPFRLVEELLPNRAKNAIRAGYALLGVAAVLLGVALLFWPGHTLAVVAVLLGIYFIVSGVVRIVSAIVELGLPAGWRVLDILVGLLLSVGGVVMLRNATLSAAVLAVLVTVTIGIGWIMEGVVALAESWRTTHSGWAVAYGLLSLVAGVIILVFPVSSTGMLVVFAGAALAVLGVVALVRAFTFGRVPR